MPVLKNARHESMAQALAKGKTADEAYALAGYKPDRGNASRLTANDSIKARVSELVGRSADRVEVTIARVLDEMRKLGFSDIRRAFDENGNLLPPTEWDDDFAASVASIEVVTKTLPGEAEDEDEPQGHGGSLRRRRNAKVEYVHKIKVWDKNSALEKLAKHLGMFIERHEHTGKNGESLIPESRADRDVAKAVAVLLAKGLNAGG